MKAQSQTNHTDAIVAGFFAVGVHALLLLMLFISFNWKTAHQENIAEVTLWDQLPAPSTPTPPVVEEAPIKSPEEIKPDPVDTQKIEKAIEEEKIKDAQNNEIALEKKVALEKKKAEQEAKRAKDAEQKKLLADLKKRMLQEELSTKHTDKTKEDALKKFQQEALAEERSANDQQVQAASAANNASEIDRFKSKIHDKIQVNVNRAVCGNGNPLLKFNIALLPTGELASPAKLTKSSGIAACDEAVERAISASEPLPVPADSGLFSQFRNLNLTFKPNE